MISNNNIYKKYYKYNIFNYTMFKEPEISKRLDYLNLFTNITIKNDMFIKDFLWNNLSLQEKRDVLLNHNLLDIYYTGGLRQKYKNNIISHNRRYNIIPNEHINYRYEIINKLGKGTYSNVIMAKDHKLKENVAIKLFRKKTEFKKIYQKETDILMYIRNNYCDDRDYLITIKDIFNFRNHMCFTTKIYGLNLYENRENIDLFSFNNKYMVVNDILQGLDFLKNCDNTVIHGDLKPENIFMRGYDNVPEVVIGDFGLSLYVNNNSYINKGHNMLQTVCYRAPEIYFKIPYNESIDIWSVGCIIYEIFFNCILVSTKKDEDLLLFIHEIFGEPDKKFIDSHKNISKYYKNYETIYIQDSKYMYRYPLNNDVFNIKKDRYKFNLSKNKFVNKKIEELLMFIKQFLEWDSVKRITPLEAISMISILN